MNQKIIKALENIKKVRVSVLIVCTSFAAGHRNESLYGAPGGFELDPCLFDLDRRRRREGRRVSTRPKCYFFYIQCN